MFFFGGSAACDCLLSLTFCFLCYEVSVLRFKPFCVCVCVCAFLFWHDICLSTEAVYQTENAVPTLSLSMGVDDLRQ